MPASEHASDGTCGFRVAAANSLTHFDFYATLVQPCLTSGTSKNLLAPLELRFQSATTLGDSEFQQCFDLIHETSAAAYRASSRGWSAADKQAEMRESEMRYLLVLDASASDNIAAFLSFMVTEEDDLPVVYCYEVHVSPAYQRRSIGAVLMKVMEDIGQRARMQVAMLTVFTSNEAAIRFYERIGYSKYDEEPAPPVKRLRSRLTGQRDWKPSYIIMSKSI